MDFSSSVLVIENMLLARYAEPHPDGTLTVVGGGIAAMARPAGNDVTLALAATLLVDSQAAGASHTVRVILRDSADNDMTQLEARLSTHTAGRHRIPLVVPIPFPSNGAVGEWTLSLIAAEELRTLRVQVADAPTT